jgi:hypothetical protein
LRRVLGDHVAPLSGSTRSRTVTPAGRFRVPSAYNRMVLQQRLSSENLMVLASTVAGTGFMISTLEAVALHLLTEVPPDGRHAWVRDLVARRALTLKVRDRTVEGEEQVQIILDGVEQFHRDRLSKFVELGILEPESDRGKDTN